MNHSRMWVNLEDSRRDLEFADAVHRSPEHLRVHDVYRRLSCTA